MSESSAYRILKAADLITAPDYVVIKAADEFTDKTTAINEMLLSAFAAQKPAGQRDRPTSPTSRSLAGAGIISAQFWTTTAVTSSPGSSATTARQGIAQQCLRGEHAR